jgi:ADP-dependent NAD(P)H-hydrate dehydratase / NAD(P)H-hydrate epimerase
VTTAAQAAARDAAAIAAGVPSRALMQRAGAAAAAEVALRYPFHLASGALVFAGPGNNGGDAWVVARALAAAGVRVRVCEPVGGKTDDTCAERALALPKVELCAWSSAGARALAESGERLVIDGLLGTGASGAPRGALAEAINAIDGLHARGATVVALDVPSGLDASTGAAQRAVTADLTVTFATVKRGILVARDRCGAVAVLDIGLDTHADLDDSAPAVVDARWVASILPPIPADAHKGTRKRVAIVGGAEGMAGATVLAARGAARSGVGMVKLVVAPASVGVVQEAEPAALAAQWPGDDVALEREIVDWADAVAIGPGLGRNADARALVERVLRAWRGPVVIDADGLNVFAGDADGLGRLLEGRPALLTPHPAEFARLAELDIEEVLASRFDVGRALAARCRATVLLKGLPTVVTSRDGDQLVSAAGTPALATAGSGDVLTGIAATLLAQIGDPLTAGVAAAWAHGRAAEIAHGAPDAARLTARGVTLDDVLCALPGAWDIDARPPRYPILLELRAVGDGAHV